MQCVAHNDDSVQSLSVSGEVPMLFEKAYKKPLLKTADLGQATLKTISLCQICQ
jgi:hypothetical protein